MTHQFSIIIERPEFLKKAEELSRSLNIPITEVVTTPFHFIVGEKLALKINEPFALGPLALDFTGGTLDYRRRYGHTGGHLILKAVGGSKKRVLDLTAGLCRDAFILASSQCQVMAIEKSPIIASLVIDAIERASGDEKTKKIMENLDFFQGESEKVLTSLESGRFDTLYLDPMFPINEKSALPKKDLRILQLLTEPISKDESEAKRLFLLAKQKAKRVVVKRPIHGAPLFENPTVVFKGSSVRFDVYVLF